MYLHHRFDLLGSGWVRNTYSTKALGVEGYKYGSCVRISAFDSEGDWIGNILKNKNSKKSRRIYTLLNDDDYLPIDWQKDFKSGYRYSNSDWFKDIKIAPKPGVDIKVSWELGRMQHLTQMAFFALRLNGDERKSIITEFRAQLIDFMATNPPEMGVNWACTMDVSIRSVNLLIAFDVLSQIDEEDILDAEFRNFLLNYLLDHGRHIYNNLENKEYFKNNHFLSNLCGLIFLSVYLKGCRASRKWFNYALSKLINQIDLQFNEDGMNNEASLGYHKLSGEMIVYTVALILGLTNDELYSLGYKDKKISSQIFPDRLKAKLNNILLFTSSVTKQDGTFPQIGDNDSGRFIKLTPVGKFLSNSDAEKKYYNLRGYLDYLKRDYECPDLSELFWDEDNLDNSSFISALSALFNESVVKESNTLGLEYSLVDALSKGNKIVKPDNKIVKPDVIDKDENKKRLPLIKESYGYKSGMIIAVPVAESLLKDLTISRFAESGIYVIKSARVYLCIYNTPLGQMGNGGHSHYDKGAFELVVDGKGIFIDPGTYLYTPIPEIRKKYRALEAHNLFYYSDVNNNNLFKTEFNDSIEIEIDCNKYRIINRNNKSVREIEIRDCEISITDYLMKEITKKSSDTLLISNGYGKLLNRQKEFVQFVSQNDNSINYILV
jgi:hypothetical protein